MPKPGRYVVAVSGGVDSVSLLHLMLQSGNDYELIVAHFDHGIRPDSTKDRIFVKHIADSYGLPFKAARVNLGSGASEETARNYRYDFLRRIERERHCDAVITAHHQDDLIETAIINILRGTGRLGLGSIRETEHLKRPLLKVSKEVLRRYAFRQGLVWREDSTNSSDLYLRNRVRHNMVARMSSDQRQALLRLIYREAELNQKIEQELTRFVGEAKSQLSRYTLNIMPYDVSKELIASWLRANNLLNFDRRTVERITLAAKTKPSGVKLDVTGKYVVNLMREHLALQAPER